MVKLHRKSINGHCVGVWDTVGAYGLPIDELTQAVDKWVWPMKFRDEILCPNVRHALSLDDARKTFFPIPWKTAEQSLEGGSQAWPAAAGLVRQHARRCRGRISGRRSVVCAASLDGRRSAREGIGP